EHMCFKGTKRRPRAIDIARELDSIGSEYNAFTSQEYTGYYAKSNPRHFKKILDVVADLYQNPVFNPIEIEKEKGVIVEEINMYEDIPYRHVQDLFTDVLYGDEPAGRNIAGTRESVRAMTANDFLDYRAKHYLAPATTVIVAGNITEEAALAEASVAFAGVPSGIKEGKAPVVEEQSEPKLLTKHRATDQVHLVLGVRSFPIYSKEYLVMKLIDALLGGGMSSRLFQKLREEMGVGYYVRTSDNAFTDHGYFDVSTGVDKNRVGDVVKALLGEFRRLKEEKVTPSELQKAKDYFTGTMDLNLESSDSLAEFYGYQEVLKKPLESPADIASAVKEVSAEDIARVATLIFTNERLNLALIGPDPREDELRALLSL
ncbi:MAG: pitrilysin family protein, partial [bacterium]|nr:pitrilysin family protein [bacterium]